MHVTQVNYKAVRGLNYLRDEEEPWPILINPSRFNLLIGPNGGGKTTLLDTIRTLSDPGIVSSLARENHLCMDSSIHIETTSGAFTSTIRIDSGSENIHARRANFKIRSLDGNFLTGAFELRFLHGETICPKDNPAKFLGGCISYIDCTKRADVDIEVLSTAINSHRHLFPQVCQAPGIEPTSATENRLWVHFEAENGYSEDGEFMVPGQSNAVPYEHIPSGWIAAARLISFIENCPSGAIVLIEEPETCLHPLLQRELMTWVLVRAELKNLQIFASSHSSVFVNVFSSVPGGAVFSAMTHRIIRWDASSELMRALGVLPSDILHANGIIWVEGESDRLYLEAWLDQYCDEFGIARPRVGVDYAVMSYGGAMLAHVLFSAEDGMSALTINRNVALIADRDDDYRSTPGGDEFIGVRAYKERARDELLSVGGFFWITEGVTIEDYLPEAVRPTSFPSGKVAAAIKAISRARSSGVNLIAESQDLREKLSVILQVIEGWGQRRALKRGELRV